jgi:hypothetical protein
LGFQRQSLLLAVENQRNTEIALLIGLSTGRKMPSAGQILGRSAKAPLPIAVLVKFYLPALLINLHTRQD